MAAINKEEFLKLLNKLIDIRIKKLVPRLIDEEMKKLKKELKEINMQQEMDEDDTIPDVLSLISSEKENVEIPKKAAASPKKESTKIYSSNPAINAVMRETEMQAKQKVSHEDIRQSKIADEYKKILSEVYADEGMQTLNFDSSDTHAIANKSIQIPQAAKGVIMNKAAQEVLKQEIAQQSGNEQLANVMVRDYRSILKKAADIAKNNRV